MQRLLRHLLSERCAEHVLRWLKDADQPVRRYLRAIANGAAVTWDSLRRVRRRRGGEQLVKTCVRASLVQLPLDTRRVTSLLRKMKREGPQLAVDTITRFWRSYVLERAQARRHKRNAHRPFERECDVLRAAFRFLQFALARQPLAAITQNTVRGWMKQAPHGQIVSVKPFLQWLFNNGVTQRRLSVPKQTVSAATSVTEPLFQATLGRVRTDNSLPLLVRIAVLIVATCARYPYETIGLRLTDIRRDGRVVWIHFAKGMPQLLAGADAKLMLHLVELRRRSGSPWLFRSKPHPESALSSHGLCLLIHEAGIDVNLNHLRNAAFRDLLKEFTPIELTQILGLQPSVAEHWYKRGYAPTQSEKAYINDLSRANGRRRVFPPRPPSDGVTLRRDRARTADRCEVLR